MLIFFMPFATQDERVNLTREMISNDISIKHSVNLSIESVGLNDVTNNNIYVLDLIERTADILKEVQGLMIFKMPARWMVFYNTYCNNESTKLYANSSKAEINKFLQPVDIGINTEFYVVIQNEDMFYLNLVYRIHKNWSLIWDELGTWAPNEGLNLKNDGKSITMKRKNLRGLNLVATSVEQDVRTRTDKPEYRNRGIDISAKSMYYMVTHLFEWLNCTPHRNATNTWGYLQADGKSFNGLIQEIDEERADISGSMYFPTVDRLKVVEFLVSPAPHIDLFFIFLKPALASVNNIFSLPFTLGVWIATLLLIMVSSLTLCFAYIAEGQKNKYYKMSLKKRLMEGFHETMCLLFQQGTPMDPVTLSTREILLIGLLSFMFLYTAYSAKIVSLLQSSTDDIKTVADFVTSPLEFGAYDKDYNRAIFLAKNKPTLEQAFYDKKVAPKGDNFFVSLEEGLQKVQKGLYAFHIERTNGIDLIQKTFYEHEKCNLGVVYYMSPSASFCYFAVPKRSKIKEQMRVGAIRMMESGVQSRSTSRVTPKIPNCGAGFAIFAAVTMMDVAPALKTLLILYAVSVLVLFIEIWIQRKKRRNLVRVLAQQLEGPVFERF